MFGSEEKGIHKTHFVDSQANQQKVIFTIIKNDTLQNNNLISSFYRHEEKKAAPLPMGFLESLTGNLQVNPPISS